MSARAKGSRLCRRTNLRTTPLESGMDFLLDFQRPSQLSGLRSTDLQQRGDDSDQHDSHVIEAIELIILKRPLIGFTAVNIRFPIDDNHDVLAFFGWLLSGPWIKACAEFMESRHDFVQTAGALMRWRCHILIFRHLQRLCI